MRKDIPFPQADDFEKIISVINADKPQYFNDNLYLSSILENVTERQVSYYLSACMYLGLIDKNRSFTEQGIKIRSLSSYRQTVEIIRILLSDSIFGTVYITEKTLGVKLDKNDVIEIIKIEYPSYSEEIYNRRYQTVRKWVNWIESKLNN